MQFLVLQSRLKSYLKSNNLELKDMILFTSRRIKSNKVSNDKWVKRPLRSYWQIISDLVTFLFQKTLFRVQLIVYIWLKMKYLYVNVIVEEMWINQVPMKWKCSDIVYLFFSAFKSSSLSLKKAFLKLNIQFNLQ